MSFDKMSDDEAKEHEPSTSWKMEKPRVQDDRAVGREEEKQMKSGDEAEKSGAARREEKAPDKFKMTPQSQVYTATRDTLFPKNTTHTRTHALVSMSC